LALAGLNECNRLISTVIICNNILVRRSYERKSPLGLLLNEEPIVSSTIGCCCGAAALGISGASLLVGSRIFSPSYMPSRQHSWYESGLAALVEAARCSGQRERKAT
jgi:hypothetical protein